LLIFIHLTSAYSSVPFLVDFQLQLCSRCRRRRRRRRLLPLNYMAGAVIKLRDRCNTGQHFTEAVAQLIDNFWK